MGREVLHVEVKYLKYRLPQKARWLILAIVLIVIVGVFLGFVVRVLELFVGLVIPVAGGAVLASFAYKLFLQPVLRQRKLDRIREYRARRQATHLDDNEQI